MKRTKFLNTWVDNITMDEAIEEFEMLIRNQRYNYIVTPNVDHIVKLEEDKYFRKIYEQADLILTDGMPLIWISKLLKINIKEKISGSDFFPRVCEISSKKNYSIFLLGAEPGVAEVAKKNLELKYENIKIVGIYSPPFGFENDDNEINRIIKLINDIKPDILAVGVGAPKQEKFIFKYKEKLKVPVCMGIGATIDFEAGNIRRAPRWMQKIGLEWLHRMIKDPKRLIKRYLIDDIKIISIYFKYRRLH